MLYAKEKKEILEVLAPNNADVDVFGACRALCHEGKSEHALVVALFAKLPEEYIEQLLDYAAPFHCRFSLGPVRAVKVNSSRNTNFHSGDCQVCGVEVGSRKGGVVHDGRGWKVVCASPHCHGHMGVELKVREEPDVERFVPEGDTHFCVKLVPQSSRFYSQKDFVRRELRGSWNQTRLCWIVRAPQLEREETRERARALGLSFPGDVVQEHAALQDETHAVWHARRIEWLIELGRALATECEKDIEKVQLEYEDYIDKALAGQRRRSKAYPELEMTEHVRQRVHEAATMMLEMCDGAITRDDAGFSKADAMMARHLYRRFREDERVDRALERMLARYHRQLRDDFPELYATQLELAA